MEFMRGGELFTHLSKKKRFDENTAKFYVSQVVLAFEYLHSNNVIYRDLKPENVIMDVNGYIKITDFGLAKRISAVESTKSFVGTPDYFCPEMIKRKGHSFMVDWWTLGIFTYELLIGKPPFTDKNR